MFLLVFFVLLLLKTREYKKYTTTTRDYKEILKYYYYSSNNKLYYLDRTCGTVQYASPEIFVSRYSEKSDIFSIGLIVFMFFTGRFLPDCKNKKFRYSKDILLSYELSNEIKNFILKCREVHIKNRFSYNEIKKNKWLY